MKCIINLFKPKVTPLPDERDFALEKSKRDLREVQLRIELIRNNLELMKWGRGNE